MVEISLHGSGEGRGWVTGPGYSTCDQARLVWKERGNDGPLKFGFVVQSVRNRPDQS